jgi:hypothetical protein
MKRWIKRSAQTILILGVIGVLIVGTYLSPIGDAPPAPVNAYVLGSPLTVVILPELGKDIELEILQEQFPIPAPRWFIKLFRPTSLTVKTEIAEKGDVVELEGLYAAPKASWLVHRFAKNSSVLNQVEGIQWNPEPFQRESEPKGSITVHGKVPIDELAKSDVDQLWNDTLLPTPMTIENNHFVEGLMDNRIGEGYLVGASLLNAMGIDLSEKNQNITISSFQFVRTIRFSLDIATDNALEIHIEMKLEPDKQNRIGAVNLKTGLSEAFSEWGKTLKQDHEITLTGKREDTDHISVYRYRVSDARPILKSMLDTIVNP